MLEIAKQVCIPETEISFYPIRAQGAGGQNVNKVSTAIHLRFDIPASSLPEVYKQRLLALRDQRIGKDGCLVIKAQRFRSQEKNKEEALQRLKEIILQVMVTPKKRKPTKPSRSSQTKRLDSKTKHSQQKLMRKKITE